MTPQNTTAKRTELKEILSKTPRSTRERITAFYLLEPTGSIDPEVLSNALEEKYLEGVKEECLRDIADYEAFKRKMKAREQGQEPVQPVDLPVVKSEDFLLEEDEGYVLKAKNGKVVKFPFNLVGTTDRHIKTKPWYNGDVMRIYVYMPGKDRVEFGYFDVATGKFTVMTRNRHHADTIKKFIDLMTF
jgi:hypothetical protein